jgi:propionyl-CoA carboxylase beta chain
VIGFVANQPNYLAGVLDINASDKIARFIRFCDAFNIPLVTLVDCRASSGRGSGTWRHHPARREDRVRLLGGDGPEDFRGAAQGLRGRLHRARQQDDPHDICFAWPTAEIAVMGAKGAVSILHGKQLAAAPKENRDAERERLQNEFQERFNSPFAAASTGYIDDVIYPRETRARVAAALAFLKDKQSSLLPKKHGNIPL